MDLISISQFLGNVGEFIGAIAVVITLVYLTAQIRQNTNALRMSAASERLERDFELVLPIIESREFAELWQKGGDQLAQLDPVDQQRLLFFERRALTLWNLMFDLRTQDLLPDSGWQEQLWIMQNIGRREAIREAWRMYRASFNEPFQKFLEAQFRAGDDQVNAGGGPRVS